MTNRPVQPVADEHLKKNTPIWKRLFSPSMPEWTPMKVAVAVFSGLAIILLSLSFIPEQSVRDFSATSVTTSSLEFSNVSLEAFDGLTTSILVMSTTALVEPRLLIKERVSMARSETLPNTIFSSCKGRR